MAKENVTFLWTKERVAGYVELQDRLEIEQTNGDGSIDLIILWGDDIRNLKKLFAEHGKDIR